MTQQPADSSFDDIPIAEEAPSPAPETAPPPPRRPRPKRQRPRRSAGSRLKWLLLLPIVAIALYSLAGYVAVPYLLRTTLPARLAQTLERPVTIGNAEFNPFTGRLTLHNTIIGPKVTVPDDPVDPLLTLSTLTLDLSAASLWQRALVCEQIAVDHLFLHVVRDRAGAYNISDLLPAWLFPGPDGGAYSIGTLTVVDSKILFDDQPSGRSHTVENLEILLPGLATVGQQTPLAAAPQISAVVDGSPVQLTGETTVGADGIEARLDLALQNFAMADQLGSLPADLQIKLVKGEADLAGSLVIANRKGQTSLQFDGTMTLRDLWLQDVDGKDLIRVPAASIGGVFTPFGKRYALRQVTIDRPAFFLERRQGGQLNLAPLFSPLQPKAAAVDLAIDHLRIEGGTVDYLDRSISGGFAAHWSDVRLSLDSLAAGAEQPPARLAVSGVSKSGSRLSAQGELATAPLKVSGMIVIDGVSLPLLQPYLSFGPDQRIKSGQATKLAGRFELASGTAPRISFSLEQLSMQVTDLVVSAANHDLLNAPRLVVDRAGLTLPDRRLQLGSIIAEEATLHLPPIPLSAAPAGDAGEGPGWTVDADAIKVGALTVQRPAPTPISTRLNEFNMSIADLPISGPGQGSVTLSGSLGPDSRFRLAGKLGMEPFTASLDLALEAVPLPLLMPPADDLPLPHPTAGRLTARGSLELPDFIFAGKAHLDGFAAVDDQDQVILRWQSAEGEALRLAVSPFSLRAQRLSVQEPHLGLAVTDKGTNFDDWLAAARDGTAQPTLAIDELTIRDGTLDLHDRTVSPPYEAMLTEINGSLNALTAGGTERCRFTAEGRWQKEARFTIEGTGSLLASPPTLDAVFKIAGLPLAPLSPYLVPHIGYELTAGRLDLTSRLERSSRALVADNHLELAGLTLGRRLSDNRYLPLTVALLMDPEGRIVMDIPVEGAVGDPEFSLRSSLLRGVRSLLLKTAVSPATLLADLKTEAPPPEAILFPYGESTLTDTARKKLASLAAILEKRPLLSVTLKGFADSTEDRQALKSKARQEEQQRHREAERQLSEQLSTAYGQEEIVLPGQETSPIPPAEPAAPLPKTIDDQTLRDLARQRSEAAADFLRQEFRFPPDRVSAAPDGEVAAGTPGRPGNRVGFSFETLIREPADDR